MELSGFNALPYVEAALLKAGLDETGFRKVARVNTPVASFEEVFDPKEDRGPVEVERPR